MPREITRRQVNDTGDQYVDAFGITTDPVRRSQLAVLDSGFDPNFGGADYWGGVINKGLTRSRIENPYDERLANQARPGQQAALQALMSSMGGQGVSGIQGNIAQNQGLQQAAAAMGNTRGGLGGAQIGAQAGAMGAGMAGDIGQARLQEYMNMANAANRSAGRMRGQDLSYMQSYLNQALDTKRINNENQLNMLGLGSGLALAQRQAELERYKLLMRLQNAYMQNNLKAAGSAANVVGTATAAAAGA